MTVVYQTAGSLGDWLSLTPLLNAKKDCKVIALDSPHTREFATLYEGLAPVEFVSPPIPNTQETNEELCFSQRILNSYGITGVSPIPIIKVRAEEIEWATNFLKDYPNPIVFANSVGGADMNKPDNHVCNYRKMPNNVALELIEEMSKNGRTLIKFGTKKKQPIYNNYEVFDKVVNIPDLSLRQVAACYHVIGEYLGTDTGDHHLMLAVGGNCITLVPPSSWNYSHARHLYLSYAWKHEPITREAYLIFDKAYPII